MMKICLLGASGSIGKQTLDVMSKNSNDFVLTAFSVGQHVEKISSILKENKEVKYICVGNEADAIKLQARHKNITFFYGDDGLEKLVRTTDAEMVVNALVGFVGLKPTLTALSLNKTVCLANKESLVVGGELINDMLALGYGKLYPIDSEHVALAKCLAVDDKNVDKLILTASGGAFRYLTRDLLEKVTPEEALMHPTWSMGQKITIDCATMINKCFEIIEAHYLFGYSYQRIGIQLHDESMIHSMVLYRDGMYRLDFGKPDMRVPITWALYEGVTDYQTMYTDDFKKVGSYHFRKFSLKRYPIVDWARYVITRKGTYGAVLNASNEAAVQAFLNHEIPFLAIETLVAKCMKSHKIIEHPSYEQLEEVDSLTREKVKKLIKKGAY